MVNAGHQQIQAKDRQQEGRDATHPSLFFRIRESVQTKAARPDCLPGLREAHRENGIWRKAQTFVLSMWSVLE